MYLVKYMIEIIVNVGDVTDDIEMLDILDVMDMD